MFFQPRNLLCLCPRQTLSRHPTPSVSCTLTHPSSLHPRMLTASLHHHCPHHTPLPGLFPSLSPLDAEARCPGAVSRGYVCLVLKCPPPRAEARKLDWRETAPRPLPHPSDNALHWVNHSVGTHCPPWWWDPAQNKHSGHCGRSQTEP